MKKRLMVVMAMLLPILGMRGQTVKPLSISDTVPDLLLSNIINYPVSKIQLSEIKAKLIILDFFSTSCAGCVRDIPKLDSLQRKYGDEILIVPITYEDKSKLQRFLSQNYLAKGSLLPFASNDTIWSSLFPHSILSHEVWVDDRRIVKAITEPELITPHNIEGMLSGTLSKLPVKKDRLDFSRSTPLTDLAGNEGRYYSLLTPELDGIPGFQEGTIYDSARSSLRFFAFNISPRSMYERTLEKGPGYYYVPNHKLIFGDSVLKGKAPFCYETVLPLQTDMQRIRNKVRSDLDCFFGIQSSMGQKTLDCLVLKKLPMAEAKLKPSNSKRQTRLAPSNKTRYIHNDKLVELVMALNREFPSMPVLDETGITSPVDLELGSVPLGDLVSLNRLLKQNGLVIEKERCTLPVLSLASL